MKRNILFALLLSFFISMSYSQSSSQKVNVGDVFVIGEADNNNYNYIDFPRANFIIKKGGLPNYEALVGEKVEIVSLKEKVKGRIIATIKLTSKKKFFNSHKYISVDIDEAIQNKELLST
ncbi:dihydroorotase [Lacinutrix chionoecetis]